jgi:hypothetical protein
MAEGHRYLRNRQHQDFGGRPLERLQMTTSVAAELGFVDSSHVSRYIKSCYHAYQARLESEREAVRAFEGSHLCRVTATPHGADDLHEPPPRNQHGDQP